MTPYSIPNTTNSSLKSKSTLVETRPLDYYNPFSYKEWIKRTTGIKVGYEAGSYQEYLNLWHSSKHLESKGVKSLKDDYGTFMKMIAPLIDSSDASSVFRDVDWDDPFDVELIIPECAKRLKQIAIYFAEKREAIRRSKLKYNMTGSTQAVERMFHDYLLRAFTKRDHVVNITDARIYDLLPELSASNKTLKIEVEEMYDDTQYFDKSPEVAAKTHFGTPSDLAKSYYATHGYDEDSLEWLLSTGFVHLCADNPLFYILDESLSADSEHLQESDYYKFRLSEKYIGTDQYWLSGGYYRPDVMSVEYPISVGNNWIYFPSGESYHETPDVSIETIMLTAASMTGQGAIGGNNYREADRFFISYGKTVKGAWLHEAVLSATDVNVIANLKTDTPTCFKFPFPGYGLSGEGLDWTGPEFTNDDTTFDTLEDDEQSSIVAEYWSTPTTSTVTIPIALQDSTLIDCGANAGATYNNADKISVRVNTASDGVHDDVPDTVYSGEIEHAWLYRMETTDIPISPKQNHIQWPMRRYEPADSSQLYSIPSSQCDSVALSSIDMTSGWLGSRAGHDLFDSDILYKLDSRNGYPIECAFLSGYEISGIGGTSWTDAATGCVQTSLNRVVSPNAYATFIWLDVDTPLDDVVFNVPHQPDCPYLLEPHHRLDKENPADGKPEIDYHQWQKCTCGAIRYSPLGHSGKTHSEHMGYSDFIFLDRLYPIPFSKSSWVCEDFDNPDEFKSYETSKNFGWYQLTASAIEGDVGWGAGRWVEKGSPGKSPRPFMLRTGYQYKYYRSNLGHDDPFILSDSVPSLIIRHKHSKSLINSFRTPRWIKAVADDSGAWRSTGEESDMVLSPGDFLINDHINSDWYCITGAGTLGEFEGEDPIAPYNLGDNQFIEFTHLNVGDSTSVSWPKEYRGGEITVIRDECTQIAWSVEMPGQNEAVVRVLDPEDPILVYGASEGTWMIGATAYGNPLSDPPSSTNYLDAYEMLASASLVASATFTDIPITTQTSGELAVHTIYSDTISYPLNVELSGWDYDNNTSSTGTPGARPFWAKAYADASRGTKGKGTSIWGGALRFEDEYVPIVQPNFSDIDLLSNSYITYEAKTPVRWVQPSKVLVSEKEQTWKKLELDVNKVVNLSAQLNDKNFCDLIVRQLDEPSDIVLTDKIDGYPVLMNYWAMDSFVWTQDFINYANGVPPTGGSYVPVVTGDLVTADKPFTNLSNRHYPTIASVPFFDGLYTKDDVGGYYTPKYLGASIALSRGRLVDVDTSRRTEDSGVGVYRDIYNFAGDMGFSNTWHDVPIRTIDEDASWMKSSLAARMNAGVIKDPRTYQQFMPYKTEYEIRNRSDIGVYQQGDIGDPWGGSDDSVWAVGKKYPKHFTKQEPISRWRSDIKDVFSVHQWKSDIYGFQYMLQKKLMGGGTIFTNRRLPGRVLFRSGDGYVEYLEDVISCIFHGQLTLNRLLVRSVDSSDIYSISITKGVLTLTRVEDEAVGSIIVIKDEYFPNDFYDVSVYDGVIMLRNVEDMPATRLPLIRDSVIPEDIYKIIIYKGVLSLTEGVGDVVSNDIYDMDMFYNTLLLARENETILYRLEYDSRRKTIINVDSNILFQKKLKDDETDEQCRYSGSWFFPELSTVVVSHLGVVNNDDVSQVYIEFCTCDISTGKTVTKTVYVQDDGSYHLAPLKSLEFSSIENAVISFNDKTNVFALTFSVKMEGYVPGLMFTVYVKLIEWSYEVSEIRCVVPGKYLTSSPID